MKPTKFFAHGDHSGGHPPSRNASADHRSHGGHHHTPEEMHNEDVAHEDSDISLPAIGWSAVVVAVTCFGTAALIYGLFFWVFIPQATARDPELSPLAMPATEMPKTTNSSPEFGSAPEPRLLTNEPRYLKGVRDREQQTLHGYAWIDEKAGVARIPIEEAKAKAISKLAVRPDPTTDPRLGTHAPAYGEASSGRTITHPIAGAPAAAPTAPAPAPAAPGHEHKD